MEPLRGEAVASSAAISNRSNQMEAETPGEWQGLSPLRRIDADATSRHQIIQQTWEFDFGKHSPRVHSPRPK